MIILQGSRKVAGSNVVIADSPTGLRLPRAYVYGIIDKKFIENGGLSAHIHIGEQYGSSFTFLDEIHLDDFGTDNIETVIILENKPRKNNPS